MEKTPRGRITQCGKRGFTLVELSVVLALVALLSTMVVSFSVFFSGFVNGNKAEYDYLEDHAALKDSLCTWLAEQDGAQSIFTPSADGLTVTANGNSKNVTFSDGVLTMGESTVKNLDGIHAVHFSVDENETLIKCETFRFSGSGKKTACTFVFYVRCGKVAGGGQ